MVNQDIVNYIQEGKRRGFKVERLKAELVNHGFEEKSVDEAIQFVENPNKAPITQTGNMTNQKESVSNKPVQLQPQQNMQNQVNTGNNLNKVANSNSTTNSRSYKFGWIIFFVLLLIIVFLGILIYVKREDIPTWIEIIINSFESSGKAG